VIGWELVKEARLKRVQKSRPKDIVERAERAKDVASGTTYRSLGQRRIEALQRQMQGSVKVDLLGGIETFKRNVDPGELMHAFTTMNYAGVREVLDKEGFTESLRPTFRRAVEGAMEGATTKAVSVLPAPVQNELRMDTSNPALQKYIKERTGALITTSEDGMLAQVKSTVHRSLNFGLNDKQAAAEIRGSIGLNERQSIALQNYRNSLADQVAKKEMTAKSVPGLVDAYNNRLLDQRAEMIARTEVRGAINMSELVVWQEAQEQGLVPGMMKQWVVDGDPCIEWCAQMDGSDPIPIDEMWHVVNTVNGKSQDLLLPGAHPNCMCMADYSQAEE